MQYQFTKPDKVDFFIVATDRQRNLRNNSVATPTMVKDLHHSVGVRIIGWTGQAISHSQWLQLTFSSGRTHYLDLVRHWCDQVRKALPDITFDIYGSEVAWMPNCVNYWLKLAIYQTHGVHDLTTFIASTRSIWQLQPVKVWTHSYGQLVRVFRCWIWRSAHRNQTFIQRWGQQFISLPVAENHVVDIYHQVL